MERHARPVSSVTTRSTSRVQDPRLQGLGREGQGDDVLSLLGEIFESMPVAMVVVAGAGRIALVNQELETLLQYSADELIGRREGT